MVSECDSDDGKTHRNVEGVYIRPKMKLCLTMKRNYVYVSFHCRRNKIKLIFVLIFWLTIFNFKKYLHVQMFPFGWLHLGVVFMKRLSLENKFYFCQNDRNKIAPETSFISGYFMWTVIRGWPDTELKILHFVRNEISCKHALKIL